MAASKLSGLLLLVAIVPFFIKGNIQYVMSIFPSFWVAKYVIDSNLVYAIVSLAVSIVWIYVLFGKFRRKIV